MVDKNIKTQILIRLPNWLGDIVMSFPLLSSLKSCSEQVEIFILVKEQYADLVFNFFPSFVVIPIRNHSKYIIKSLYEIEIFRALRTKLNRQSIYISLTLSSLPLIGTLLLPLKIRFGFKETLFSSLYKKSIPYTLQKIHEKERIHRSKTYLQFLTFLNFLPKDFNLKESFNESKKVLLEKPSIIININSEATSRTIGCDWIIQLIQLKKETFSKYQIIFIGLKKDYSKIDQIISKIIIEEKNPSCLNMAGKTDIMQLFQLIRNASLVISSDSGPAHLASLTKVPLIVTFGAGDEKETSPRRIFELDKNNNIVILKSKKSFPCSPCRKNSCELENDENELSSSGAPCLNTIDPNIVSSLIDLLLSKNS